MPILLSFLFLLTVLLASAQNNVQPQSTRKPDSVWAFTASPLALLQLDFTAMGGAEYKLNSRLKLVADAGWIFASVIYGSEEGARGASGFIIRPGIKYFPSNRNHYLQAQVFYKQVTHRLYDWLDMDVENGVPAYEQLQEFRFRRKIVGLNFILGVMRPLFKSKKVFADIYLGAGIRYKSAAVVGEEDSQYEVPGAVTIGDGEPLSVLPSIPCGVRLVFLLRP